MLICPLPTSAILLPDGEINHNWTPQVESIRFGDGYHLRYESGALAETQTFDMQYTNISQADRNTLWNFLWKRRGTNPFTFKFLSDPAARKFITKEGLRDVRRNGEWYDVSFTMEEVKDIDNGMVNLFYEGGKGGWYDPSDITTLFQDTAGATPVTTTGQTVGLMRDKSGNGLDLVQATAANRPTYQAGGGQPYLAFDSTDSLVQSAATYAFGKQHYIAMAVQRAAQSLSMLMGPAKADNYHRLVNNSANLTGGAQFMVASSQININGANNSWLLASKAVLDTQIAPGALTFGVNNVLTSIASTWTATSSMNVLSMTIGGTAAFDFYGGVAFTGDMDVYDRQQVCRLLGAKIGLSL